MKAKAPKLKKKRSMRNLNMIECLRENGSVYESFRLRSYGERFDSDGQGSLGVKVPEFERVKITHPKSTTKYQLPTPHIPYLISHISVFRWFDTEDGDF